MVLADIPTWLQYPSKQCPLDKKYHATRVGGVVLTDMSTWLQYRSKQCPLKRNIMLQGWGDGARVLADTPTWLQYRSKHSSLDKRYHASRGGDGASRHAHLITVSFKTQPSRQEVSCFKNGGGGMVLADIPAWLEYLTKQSPLDKKYYATRVGRDGASRHAHLITVSFKTMPIRQEISCFKVLGC